MSHCQITAKLRAGLILFGLLLFAPAAAGQLPPEDELRTLAARAGLEVTLYASEPLITNPAAIDIDTHGRVWVAEIQWYRPADPWPPPGTTGSQPPTRGREYRCRWPPGW